MEGLGNLITDKMIFDESLVPGKSAIQNQPSGGVPRKRRSENMRQIYRKTSMSKCDFNIVALFFKNHTSARVFSCKFTAYFQNTFS